MATFPQNQIPLHARCAPNLVGIPIPLPPFQTLPEEDGQQLRPFLELVQEVTKLVDENKFLHATMKTRPQRDIDLRRQMAAMDEDAKAKLEILREENERKDEIIRRLHEELEGERNKVKFLMERANRVVEDRGTQVEMESEARRLEEESLNNSLNESCNDMDESDSIVFIEEGPFSVPVPVDTDITDRPQPTPSPIASETTKREPESPEREPVAGPSGNAEVIEPKFTPKKETIHGRLPKSCLCGLVFETRSDLERHLEEKIRGNFVCDYPGCAAEFSTLRDAASHKKRAHKGHKRFPCSGCRKFFGKKEELKRHRSEDKCQVKRIRLGFEYVSLDDE